MSSDAGTIEIREVTGDEYIETGRAVADYAFGTSPIERDLERARKQLPYNVKARNLVAYIDGQPQATATSHAMTQNVRGTVVAMGGVGAVASMPSGRRRGTVRRIFEQMLAMQREMGMPVSTLYPFRDSFYERLGYAGFPKPRYLTLKPETLAPLVRIDKPGTCEQVPMRAGFEEWHAYLEWYQSQTHGFSLKQINNARQWQDANEWWVAFARHEGHIVGAMTFKITEYSGKLIAGTFYTVNSVGRYLLLDWVGRHTDQVKEAIIELRPDDYPEVWFRDLDATVTCGADLAWPAPMARVVDVSQLGGIGAGTGSVTLDVSDALCPWNNGRFTMRADNGTLVVEEGGDCATPITIQGLSALVFSGHDPADFQFRGWGEPDTKMQADLRTLFPAMTPDMHETF